MRAVDAHAESHESGATAGLGIGAQDLQTVA
jgi:hypothetical protein